MKGLLKSPAFWTALLTVIVMVIVVFVPGFKVDIPHLVSLAVIVSTFLVAFAINPTGFALLDLLGSRRFIASMLGLIVVVLDGFHVLPVTLDTANLIGLVALLCFYVVMTATDPGIGWRGLLASRKFITLLVGLLMIVLNTFKISLPASLTQEQILGIATTLCGFIAYAGYSAPPIPELPDPVDDTASVGIEPASKTPPQS
jgi:hypothetical protein